MFDETEYGTAFKMKLNTAHVRKYYTGIRLRERNILQLVK